MIERGQTQAIQSVRNIVNPTSTAVTGEATEPNTIDTSTVPAMVYVDDEGLEE